MSTAAEIMLRAEFASPLSRLIWAHALWRVQLRIAAESTRYQLTYTPGP